MIKTLSKDQARKIILLSQGLPPVKQKGSASTATLAAIERLGYVQIDTISVIERAHHHTLWNRNPRYNKAHLDKLLTEKRIFEYWSHAAAYLPMRDYRYSLPRKQAILSGVLKHWYDQDKRLMKFVLNRIAKEGPLMAKDFESQNKTADPWGSKPTKRALENLFMQGALMVPHRINFHKVYDLTERVLPEDIDTSVPTEEEYGRFLVEQYLRANGLGQISEMVYLLKKTKSIVSNALEEMVSAGEVMEIRTEGLDYFTLPTNLELLNKRLARRKLKILSPFDNLLIQRKRMKTLFDFDYVLECYLPKEKRAFGYFSLPILWNGRFVGQMDCKHDRNESILHIVHLFVELNIEPIEMFFQALVEELRLFMEFNQSDAIRLHRVSPPKYKLIFQACVSQRDLVKR